MFYNIKTKLGIAVIFLLLFAVGLQGNPFPEQFTIGDLVVQPGELRSGYLSVPVEEEIDCFIPVTVIHGAREGKILALVAGVHGYEYPPILSLYRLKQMIDPAKLSGTLILVHIANLPSFQRRSIYFNPYDWKNLNRVFPGNPEGSQSERIAFVLVEEVIKKCDMLIDMHCGDGNEALIPYSYWMVSGDKRLDDLSKELVLAFGLKHIIIDKSRSTDLAQSKYLGNTALLLGIPAITTESGYLGLSDEESVVRNIKGVFNVMRRYSMIEGEPDKTIDPVWIDKYEVIYSDQSGLFFPLTQMGWMVKKGETIGYVVDYLGNTKHEYKAPFTGMILYIINTPPANKGEPLYEIGQLK